MSKKNGEYRFSAEQFRKMREAGMGVTVMAKVYGCHEQTIKNWLKKFGMPTKLDPVEFPDEYVDAAITEHNRRRQARFAYWVNYKH